MPPADNHVATIFLVAMFEKAAAFKFKFNAHALPLSADGFSEGFTVWECRLNMKHNETEPPRKHAENKDDAKFVHRLMREFRKQDGAAVNRAITKYRTFADTLERAGFWLCWCDDRLGFAKREYILPFGFDFGFMDEVVKGFRNACPPAVASLKGHDAEASGAAVFMDAGNFLELACDGSPVQQQGRFRLAESGSGNLQACGDESFGEPTETLVQDLFRDANSTQVAQVGVAF